MKACQDTWALTNKPTLTYNITLICLYLIHFDSIANSFAIGYGTVLVLVDLGPGFPVGFDVEVCEHDQEYDSIEPNPNTEKFRIAAVDDEKLD